MKPKRAAALALTAAILCSVPARADDLSQAKERIAALTDQYDALESQQKLIDEQIGRAETEKERRLAETQRLDARIELAAAQIELLDERILLLEGYAADLEGRAAEKQREIDESYGAFKKRLRAMAKMPRISNLGIALGTNSYYEFVDSAKVMARVAAYDKEILAELADGKKALEEAEKGVRQNQDGVRRAKEQLNEKKQDLGYRLAESRRQIQDMALLEQQFMANRDALRRQMKEVEEETGRIYDEIAGKSDLTEYADGGQALGSMARPAPALDQITSPYGPRFGGSNFHTGMDFSKAGAYGQQIVAANGGKVAFVNTAYTPGYGYGKYLIIDHGGGITTLYAHCSEINVQPGQLVSKGEPIAKVGSTGWSTGPHCHFEVRVNGSHTNPVPYLEPA